MRGGRPEPRTLIIGTAGYDKQSIAWELDQHTIQVRDGVINNPTFAPFIYRLDEEDEWTDFENLRKAKGHPAEQEEYLEGLLSGLSFTPLLRTNTTSGGSPWDRAHQAEIQNRLYFQERKREQLKEEEKIPSNFRMDTIAATAFRLRVFQRVRDQEHVDQHQKLIQEAEGYWREQLNGAFPSWWNWALKG